MTPSYTILAIFIGFIPAQLYALFFNIEKEPGFGAGLQFLELSAKFGFKILNCISVLLILLGVIWILRLM